jgi:hypothetical protein
MEMNGSIDGRVETLNDCKAAGLECAAKSEALFAPRSQDDTVATNVRMTSVVRSGSAASLGLRSWGQVSALH